MGFFSGLDNEGYDRQYNDRELIRRIIKYFTPYRNQIVIIGIALVLVSLAGAASPILVGRAVDLLGQSVEMTAITLISAAVLLTGFIVWGANWVRRRLTSRAIGDMVMSLRTDAFSASAGHDLSFFDEFSSGRIVSRITSDTQEFAQVVVLVTDLISQLIQTMFLAVFLFATEWRLALVLFAFMPIVFAVALSFLPIVQRFLTSSSYLMLILAADALFIAAAVQLYRGPLGRGTAGRSQRSIKAGMLCALVAFLGGNR